VRRSFAALIVLGLGLALAGCAQLQNPTYDVGKIGCGTAPDKTIATIQEKVTANGFLRNGKVLTEGGNTFVSAELHLRTDDRHAKGDVLTWVTTDVNGNDFFSVDVNARDDSSWPDADINVTAPGARESRACAEATAGKTKAQIKCEQDQSQGQVPADLNCGSK
jgi:hypothetical protein